MFSLLLVVVMAAALSGIVGPWMQVASVPIEAEIETPPGAKVHACSGEVCVRLIPRGELWLGEFPPMQKYEPVINSDSGAILRSIRLIRTNREEPVTSWLDAALIFALSTSLLWLLTLSVFAMSRPQQIEVRNGSRFYWVSWGLLSALGLALIAGIPVRFSGDTPTYLRHAIALLDGNYSFPGADPWNATVRPPGYPAFLTFTFLFTRDLSVVVLVQYAIHAISVGLLGSLLPTTFRAFQVVFLVFGLLGLQHIVINGALLSDGLCASMLLLAFYFFLRFKMRGHGMVWFGLCVGAAALSRPAATIVLVLLLPDILRAVNGMLNRRIADHRAVLIGVLIAIAPMFAWGLRNTIQHSYFGISSYGPLVRLAGLIETGLFNASSNEKVYDFYVLGRHSVGYEQFHSQMSEVAARISGPSGRQYIRRLNGAIDGITNASLDATPLVLRAAGFFRALYWGLFFPSGQTYGGYRHREYDQLLREGFHSPGNAIRAQSVSDLPLTYPIKEPSPLAKAYAKVVQVYPVIYPYLVAAAFVAAIVMLLNGHLILAMPVLFYFFNVVTHAYIGVPFGRYIQQLDVLLLFSIVAAFSRPYLAANPLRPIGASPN